MGRNSPPLQGGSGPSPNISRTSTKTRLSLASMVRLSRWTTPLRRDQSRSRRAPVRLTVRTWRRATATPPALTAAPAAARAVTRCHTAQAGRKFVRTRPSTLPCDLLSEKKQKGSEHVFAPRWLPSHISTALAPGLTSAMICKRKLRWSVDDDLHTMKSFSVATVTGG